MAFETKSYTQEKGVLSVVYTVKHENKTSVLDQDLTVQFSGNGKVKCSMSITECDADSFEAGMSRMADWLERMAFAIRERKPPEVVVPIYPKKLEHWMDQLCTTN